MPRHIWVNSRRLKSAIATERFDGVELTVGISPYNLPRFVVGHYDPKLGHFVIQFKYLDDEKPDPKTRNINGILIREGQHSRKILSISLPVDQGPLDRIAIIDLRTKILDALRERGTDRTRTSASEMPDAMNQDVAEELLDEANLKELAADLTVS